MVDDIPSTPGKFKPDKSSIYFNKFRWYSSLSKLTLWSFLFLSLLLFLFLASPRLDSSHRHDSTFQTFSKSSATWGGHEWERRVRQSARVKHGEHGITVLVTGAAGFVGTHVSMALRRRGDGVLGLDNFNNYYDPSLKRARQNLLTR